jgi:hypothetical protein
MKKILLIEPNPYHTDGLPGIARYLNDLCYAVDVYIQTPLLKDNAFCWHSKPPRIFNYEFSRIKELLKTERIAEYDFIFFYSMEISLDGSVTNIIQYLGFIPRTKYGILGIYHTTSYIDRFQDYHLMAEGRFFCLSDFQIHNYNIAVLNPHYYGDMSTDRSQGDFHSNNNPIICIGNAFDTNMLSDALYQIYKMNKSVKIIHYGGKNQNFIRNLIGGMITFITSRFNQASLKKHLFRKYVIRKGKVTFENLFSALVNCKYILVLINPHTPEHNHYITYTTSGIRQIILGFKKIPIIHEEVAIKYGFDRTNSILYNDKNLSSALLVNPDNYTNMVNSLSMMENTIYSFSLSNLKNVISQIISRNEQNKI